MKRIFIITICLFVFNGIINCQEKLNREDSLLKITRQLFVNQKYDSALVNINKLLVIDTNNCNYYNLKGAIYNGLKEYNVAEKLYFKSIDKGCDKHELFLYLKRLYFIQKKYSKALEYINKAIYIKPDSGYLYVKRSAIKMLLGDQEGMKSDLIKAQEKGYEDAEIMLKAIEKQEKKNRSP